MFAIERGNLEIIKILLRNNPNIYIKNNEGKSN
jgi:hypothetical protein